MTEGVFFSLFPFAIRPDKTVDCGAGAWGEPKAGSPPISPLATGLDETGRFIAGYFVAGATCMETVKNFVSKHPQITSWIVLAIGMVIILVWSAKDVGFTAAQWVALIVTTILLAGVSVWIIGWEDDDYESEDPEATVATDQNQPVEQ
jgi:uncharacterized protein (DUF983 family)